MCGASEELVKRHPQENGMTGTSSMAELRQAVSPYLLSIRGTLAPATLEAARSVHNQTSGAPESIAAARSLGDLSDEAYFRLAEPGSPESRELLAVDVWSSAEAMGAYYDDPAFGQAFHDLFSGEPQTSIWVHPAGEWVEW